MGDFGQDDMPPMRTYAYTGGFFTQRRIRRIMELSGHPIRFGLPNSNDCVAVWGNSPRAHRGITVAQKRQASLIYVEDAFIRSLFPARQSATPPKGLLIDRSANHFDASKISDLERILTQDPLDHGGDLQRARCNGAHAFIKNFKIFCPRDRHARHAGGICVGHRSNPR